eukprot:4418776-Amphidinium_carterae.1
MASLEDAASKHHSGHWKQNHDALSSPLMLGRTVPTLIHVSPLHPLGCCRSPQQYLGEERILPTGPDNLYGLTLIIHIQTTCFITIPKPIKDSYH